MSEIKPGPHASGTIKWIPFLGYFTDATKTVHMKSGVGAFQKRCVLIWDTRGINYNSKIQEIKYEHFPATIAGGCAHWMTALYMGTAGNTVDIGDWNKGTYICKIDWGIGGSPGYRLVTLPSPAHALLQKSDFTAIILRDASLYFHPIDFGHTLYGATRAQLFVTFKNKRKLIIIGRPMMEV